jgi:hypothetical protein
MSDGVGSWPQLVEWKPIITCTRLLSDFFGTEKQDNRTWFIENLKKAVGDPPLLAVSSDACKGLANTVKTVFAHVEQRECFRHLMENYVKRFVGAEHMYPAARAYRKIVHEHHKVIPRCNPNVFYWLDEYHSLLWYRSGFNPAIKCDYVTNNRAESINN